MADSPTPRGRGARLLEKLKQQQQIEEVSTQDPPKPRGRAHLLARLKADRSLSLGLKSGEKLFDKPESSTSKPPIETDLKDTEAALQDSSVTETDQPKQYLGESGRKFPATANFIRLNIEQDRGIFEYEVRFEPPVDAKNNRIKLVNLALGDLADSKVFDGGSALFVPRKISVTEAENGLPSNPAEIVKTRLIYKKQCKLSDSPAIRAYNVLLKRIMHILLFSKMGRNFFNMANSFLIPQHKLEIFPGYAVTAEEQDGGLLLCLDTQHKLIRNSSVYEFLIELRSANPVDFKAQAGQGLTGTIVVTKYNNKTYKIDDIEWDMSPNSTFQTPKGEITFVDYYKNHYDIEIRYFNQPLLINRQMKSTSEGGEKVENLICLVPELCYFTGLSDAMRADFKIMKDVAAYTKITPNQRIAALQAYLKSVRESDKCQKLLKSWGISIANDTIGLTARALGTEYIYFGDNSRFTGQDWNIPAVKRTVIQATDFNKWIIFYTNRDAKVAQQMADVMLRFGDTIGCHVNKPLMVALPNDRSETFKAACWENISKDTQFAVFIFPSIREDRYKTIKNICLCSLGVASQVVLSKTLSNPKKQQTIISKIVLQINCKLGGALWTVKIPVTGWMCIGIDVCHADKRSVCGIVCSINDSFTKWYSEATFQSGEIGDHYRMAFKKALEGRRLQCGSHPKLIIVTRDGVGDGQFDHVSKYEVPQFESVLKELNIDAKLVFVVVQKRISTRIFAMEQSGAVNPPAGTIVDSVITRKGLYDFFLVPQTVTQGTVNPTHYVVLYDTYNIKPDHIQRFMYKMCHLYYNWSGTIRVPAPCQYAHKLASLIGTIQANPLSSQSNLLYYL